MTDNQDDARHKQKMANRKAAQDAEVASKTTIEKGLLIVHTGKGKGKSTAAFGLLLRALGRGFKAGVVQFGKGAWETGERTAISKFGDQVVWYTLGEGFTWETQDRTRDVAAAERAWEKAVELMADPAIRMLILDELNISLRYDHLDLAKVVATLASPPPRSAHRRHRPQRQAGADRGRRPRHRDGPAQASLRCRRARAGRHRILMSIHPGSKRSSPSPACPGDAGAATSPQRDPCRTAKGSPPPCGEGLGVGGNPTANDLQSSPPASPTRGRNCNRRFTRRSQLGEWSASVRSEEAE